MSLPTLRQFSVLASFWLLLALVAVVTGGGGVAAVSDSPGENATQSAERVSPAETAVTQRSVEGPGAQLSGVVAVQDRTIRGTVEAGSFQAQLEAAGSPAETAAVVDRVLTSTEQRVTELEQQVSSLPDGTGQDVATAKRADVGSSARALDDLLAESERVATELPPDVRESRNLEARIDTLGDRIETLRQQTRESFRTVTGGNETTRVDSLSVEDVEAATNSALDSSGQNPLLDSETIEFRIHTANGSTLRVGLVTDGNRVERVQRGGIDNPDVRVYTDYEVVREVQRSDEPLAAFQDAVDDDRLIYDGVGLLNSVQYGVLSILA